MILIFSLWRQKRLQVPARVILLKWGVKIRGVTKYGHTSCVLTKESVPPLQVVATLTTTTIVSAILVESRYANFANMTGIV